MNSAPKLSPFALSRHPHSPIGQPVFLHNGRIELGGQGFVEGGHQIGAFLSRVERGKFFDQRQIRGQLRFEQVRIFRLDSLQHGLPQSRLPPLLLLARTAHGLVGVPVEAGRLPAFRLPKQRAAELLGLCEAFVGQLADVDGAADKTIVAECEYSGGRPGRFRILSQPNALRHRFVEPPFLRLRMKQLQGDTVLG